MLDLPHNPDREQLRNHYEASGDAPTDCWENFGDVNPQPHGGDWVVYKPEYGKFELRGTYPAIEMGFDIPTEEELQHQYVYQNECRFGDIVTEDGYFTESARSTAESLYSCPSEPSGLVADGRVTWFVVAYLDEYRYPYARHPNNSVYEGDYYDILDRVGVDPCE